MAARIAALLRCLARTFGSASADALDSAMAGAGTAAASGTGVVRAGIVLPVIILR